MPAVGWAGGETIGMAAKMDAAGAVEVSEGSLVLHREATQVSYARHLRAGRGAARLEGTTEGRDWHGVPTGSGVVWLSPSPASSA